MARPVTVSDHALCRYLERVKGIDLATIRAEIATIVQPAVSLGAPFYSLDGFTYVIKNDTLTTIIEGRSGYGIRAGGALMRGKQMRLRR